LHFSKLRCNGNSNRSFHLTKPLVTHLACARSAPNDFAGEANVITIRATRGMNSFHRHLLNAMFANLVRAVAVLMVVVVTMGLPEFFAGANRTESLEIAVFLLLVFEFVLPLGVLLAALFSISSIARNHEVTALKAAGWSTARIVAPVAAVGIAAAVILGILGLIAASNGTFSGGGAAAETANYARAAYPFSCIIAVAIGIALGVTRRERTRYQGFLSAFVVLVAFYVLSAAANALGKHGWIPPSLAGWSATIVFAGVAGVLWWRAA